LRWRQETDELGRRWDAYDPFHPEGPWVVECKCGTWAKRVKTRAEGRRRHHDHKVRPQLWTQVERDNSQPRLGSAVLVQDGDTILMGRRAKEPNKGLWVIPGGKIEPFETIAEAGRRELREETGLDVVVGEQLGVFEIVNPPDEHRVIVYSWGWAAGGHLRAASDVSELKFVTRDELARLPVSEFVRGVLRIAGLL
jgi:ADP-ribose pyrophosphatase YjhB (NUDIX family)